MVEQRAVEGQFVLYDLAVDGERGAKRTVLIGAENDLVGVFIERGLGGSLVDDAGRGAEAEEQRIRTAGDFDGLRVIGVEGDAVIRWKIIDRGIGSGEATDAVRLGVGRAVAVVAEAVAGDGILGRATVDDRGRVGAGALGAGLVFEDVVDIERCGVVHLLPRHDGDRGGEVGQVGIEAAAGESVLGEIAGVLRRRDLERRQHDGGVFAGGRDAGGGPSLVGLHGRNFVGVEFAVLISVVLRK